MTKLLDRAIETLRGMTPSDQDAIADMILAAARVGGIEHARVDDVSDALEGLAQVDRGEVATDEQIEATFRRFRP